MRRRAVLKHGTSRSTRALSWSSQPFGLRGRRLGLELLEDKIVLALGSPLWVEQGPGPILNGQVEGMVAQNNPVAGAIEAIVAHPTDPDTVFVGAVNGGIWKTTNATQPSPTWIPLTDDLPSLAISAVAFDPTNPQVMYAGTGSFSSANSDGGGAIGILKSTNAGNTWNRVGGTTLDGFRIRSVVPTTLDGGNVVLVAAQDAGGIFRSADGGATFVRLSGNGTSGIPDGLSATHLVADPANPHRFYAGIGIGGGAAQGVYRSDDGGVTWTQKNSGITTFGGDARRTELSVHYNPSGPTHAVYVATIDGNGRLSGIFRSSDQAETWTAMDIPEVTEAGGNTIGLHPGTKNLGGSEGTPSANPGSQGRIHFSLLADRDDPNIVFVGGDRQPDGIEGGGGFAFPNAVGANDYSGRLFRGDASQLSGSQWSHVTHSNTVSNSAPHADSRDMVFDANGNILEADDGGIYRLLSPNDAAQRDWQSVNGDIRVTEFYSAAYDNLLNTIWSGNQDVGTTFQSAVGSTAWDTREGGDGGIVQIDNSDPTEVVIFNSTQRLERFNRVKLDATGTVLSVAQVGLQVNGSGGQKLTQYDPNVQFINPYVLNSVDQERVLLGTAKLYESFDQADTLDDLGGFNGRFVSGLAYGGRADGVDNPDVIYAGIGSDLVHRAAAGGVLNTLSTYTGSTIRDVAVNPDDWRTVYVIDRLGSVYLSDDAGATGFIDVSGNLPTLTTDLRTIEVFPGTPALGDEVVFVGGLGGVFGTDDGGATWSEFGTGLPNAQVRDLRYDPVDDVLLAGTLGRGAWTISQVGSSVQAATVAGRHIFYDNSAFDDGPGPDPNDDQAIAPDLLTASTPSLGKTALLPLQNATFQHYTSYSRGINGVMVDLQGLANPTGIDAGDFEFRVGNDTDPSGWGLAPAPSAITVRPGEGVSGSDRISVYWNDGAIQQQWLQVKLLATADTNLAQPDVHYWGNQIGETGNQVGSTAVNALDVGQAVNNVVAIAGRDNPLDIDRSGTVDGLDVGEIGTHATGFTSLLLFASPAPPAVPRLPPPPLPVPPRVADPLSVPVIPSGPPSLAVPFSVRLADEASPQRADPDVAAEPTPGPSVVRVSGRRPRTRAPASQLRPAAVDAVVSQPTPTSVIDGAGLTVDLPDKLADDVLTILVSSRRVRTRGRVGANG